MSGAGPRLAPDQRPSPPTESLPKGRSPLAHLLHALNQPLTGLQCSLELALVTPRRREEYVRILQEGLQLAGRMRILVEGIRELADQPNHPAAHDSFAFGQLLKETVESLAPVAESKSVRLSARNLVPLAMRGDPRSMATLLFRLLDAALSLTRTGSELIVEMVAPPAQACLVVTWTEGPLPENSPFSRPELGLLIAQSGFERAGAQWTLTRDDGTVTCSVRLPPACN